VGEQRRLIGEILVEMGFTDLSSINEARRVQMNQPQRRLGELLIEMGCVRQEQLQAALARQTSQSPPPR
jgi:hypothetical protein